MATNTVPIEIVLQDPNNPIVPPSPDPSGPGDPGENTNILVPDTALGTGTTKDSNGTNGIFSGTNATASIASIIVLVLALGAIITLLVRRYQKHKKSTESKAGNVEQSAKVSRKEKLLTATSGTLAVLAATVLVGNLLITATNAATANEGTTLDTPDKIQIIANRYDDVTIVASAKAVSYASTDTTFGYKIFMSMAGDDANLYLDGDEASEYYFAPTTRAGLSNNSWGYSLDDGAEQAMPLASDPIVAQQTTEAVEDEEFTVYYTMKADKDMPFGVYSGEIAYDIQGYNGFPETLTTMQGMTSEICENTYTPNAFKADGVTIEDNVPTATLTDVRDNKTYTIAKLADGKCWMTQNLDLQKEDLLAGVTLDNTNTDHPADGFELPDSQTTGNDEWDDGFSSRHIYDLAGTDRTFHYCLQYDSYGRCEIESEENIPPQLLGNYYNWNTATAGTGANNTSLSEASGSICPFGWKLPKGSASGLEDTDYSSLISKYGIIRNTSGEYKGDNSDLLDSPFQFILTGYYQSLYTGNPVQDFNYAGYLWTSFGANNYDTGTGQPMLIRIKYLNPWDYQYATRGDSIRCIAR